MSRNTLAFVLGGVTAIALSGCAMVKDAPSEDPYRTDALREAAPADEVEETSASAPTGRVSRDLEAEKPRENNTRTASEEPAAPPPAMDPAPEPAETESVALEGVFGGDMELDLDGDAFDDLSIAAGGESAGLGSASGTTASASHAADAPVSLAGKRGRAKPARIAKKAEEMRRQAPVPVAPSRTAVPDNNSAPVRESQTEDYTDYGINGFTLTERDGLSTFAVDVDTASYTITRRKLREGYLPPQAAVRVEEFVNYFPYEYAQPKAGHPFAVDVEAAPSPYNPQNHIVRIGVQGKKVQFDTRRPVNLTFLVDVSGSMQSRDKIGLLKDTLRMLTNELEDGDTVALVTYAGATKVVLRPTPISQRGRILSALDGLTAGGSTAMGAGVELAYAQAEATYRPGSVNRVIVASDGDANVGITSHTSLSNFIAKKAKKGITLTTLGFGNGNYKDTMMERLANDGDGNYYYIDSIQESRRLFVDQLSSTLEVIAKDVKIQVDWNPETVLAYRLIGYENRDIADRDFRNDAVDAGEIGAGHQVTALYEVALRDDLSGGFGTVRIRNKAPGPESPAVERQYAVPTKVLASRFSDATPQFRIQTAAAGFAEILRDSPHMNEVQLRDVAAIARAAKRVEYNEDSELVELIERASQLKGERAVSRR